MEASRNSLVILVQVKEGFEVLTAVVTKSSVFWDITPSIPLKLNRHFGGTCRLHLQGRRINQARNKRERKHSDPRVTEEVGDTPPGVARATFSSRHAFTRVITAQNTFLPKQYNKYLHPCVYLALPITLR
jgi:hypothetical protein